MRNDLGDLVYSCKCNDDTFLGSYYNMAHTQLPGLVELSSRTGHWRTTLHIKTSERPYSTTWTQDTCKTECRDQLTTHRAWVSVNTVSMQDFHFLFARIQKLAEYCMEHQPLKLYFFGYPRWHITWTRSNCTGEIPTVWGILLRTLCSIRFNTKHSKSVFGVSCQAWDNYDLLSFLSLRNEHAETSWCILRYRYAWTYFKKGDTRQM